MSAISGNSGSISRPHPMAVRQLSSGLLVSGGPPEPPPKDRPPTLSSFAAPYTGGDVRRSGELGKMLNIPSLDPAAAAAAPATSSSSRPNSRSHSGPIPKRPASSSSSGPLSQIPATGLITGRSAGQDPDPDRIPRRHAKKKEYGTSVTEVREKGLDFKFAVPRAVIWAGATAFVVGLGVGILVMVVVGKFVILAAVAAAVVGVAAVGAWNWGRGRKEVERFLRGFPDTGIDPRNLPVGQIVKVTGLVTCGAAPLETSYQNVSRCVYVSTELYEYRGWNGLPVNSKHKPFSWGLRHSERHVSDFYISDPNSGTRFLVRAGSGARVVSFVKSATIVDMTKKNRELTPTFLSWLTDHNLSRDGRILRLEEGFIKEGGTASVMGILRKHENLTIIDQPRDIISTGCLWKRCFFPMYVEGLILIGDKRPEGEVCHV